MRRSPGRGVVSARLGRCHHRGVVQRYYGAFGTFSANGGQTGYGRDWHYDPRGFVPPYYPNTMRFQVDQPAPLTTAWRED